MERAKSHERRRSPRVAVSAGLWVSWHTSGVRRVSRVRDLSEGGAFISEDAPPPVGTPIHLLFALPEGEIQVEGMVRFQHEKDGMGVQFWRMSDGARVRLQELLRRLNTQSGAASESKNKASPRAHPDRRKS